MWHLLSWGPAARMAVRAAGPGCVRPRTVTGVVRARRPPRRRARERVARLAPARLPGRGRPPDAAASGLPAAAGPPGARTPFLSGVRASPRPELPWGRSTAAASLWVVIGPPAR